MVLNTGSTVLTTSNDEILELMMFYSRMEIRVCDSIKSIRGKGDAGYKIENICREQIKFCYNDDLSLYWIENIDRKGKNAGSQHFLLFSQCFQK